MRTIGDWMRINYRRYSTREALVSYDQRLTYGELAERTWQLARGLQKIGITAGSNVGVLGTNTMFNAEMFFGVATSGGCYVAYNWRWAAQELANGIKETGASVILVEAQFEQKALEALQILGRTEADLPVLLVEGHAVDSLRVGTGVFESPASLDSPLCIIYTGGSTGTPKGVVISHSAAGANAINEMYDCGMGARPNERGLILTPFFHSAALLCWLVPHFISGSTSIIAEKFNDELIVDLVERESVTNTFLIPNMMRRLSQSGVFQAPSFSRSMRAIHTGAGLLRMPDKELFAEQLPDAQLFFRYGLTEAGPMVSRLLPQDMLDPGVDGSIGTEYLLAEVQLQDLEGREVPTGELGEICVKGPSLMTGYYGRPEATADAFRGGWLHTGDLAVRDERGYLFFRDRLKEMIKTGGENVYSAEIEQALYLHPAVLEAVVVGVPDPKWDEEVRAVVVLRDGKSAGYGELATHLRQHLAGYKIPKQIVFLAADELPRSAAGKLVKSQLKSNLGWAS